MARNLAAVRRIVNMALGSHEAAAVMGVHHSVPQRMADRGWIAGRALPTAQGVERRVMVFDGRECQGNYEEYDAKVVARGGTNDRRPRAWLHHRDPMIERLAAIEPEERIAYDDAIGAAEAAKILGVHHSFVPRLARDGHIVGRLLHGRDQTIGGHRRNWIFSRRSCLANAKAVKAAVDAGEKIGRPRNFG